MCGGTALQPTATAGGALAPVGTEAYGGRVYNQVVGLPHISCETCGIDLTVTPGNLSALCPCGACTRITGLAQYKRTGKFDGSGKAAVQFTLPAQVAQGATAGSGT